MDSIGDQFLSRQRVLVIAPHADDETYGCAGTIARIKDLGRPGLRLLISVGSLDHYASNARRTGDAHGHQQHPPRENFPT